MMLSEDDLTIKVKLRYLKIKDELQGRHSENPQYLACSVLKNEMPLGSPSFLASRGRDMSVAPVSHDDDDAFTDALADFLSVSDSSVCSPRMEIFESAEALLHEQHLLQGKGICNEIFYDVEGGDNLDFVSFTFSTRSTSSSDYDGVDTQVFDLNNNVFQLQAYNSFYTDM